MGESRLETNLADFILDGILKEERSITWPYDIQGIVHTNFNNRTSSYQSGTLISSKLVLTAASNIFSDLKENPVSIYFLQRSKVNNEIISTRVIDFYYPEEFKTTGKENYALLVLECDASTSNQYFELRYFKTEELISSDALIYGFPSNIKGQFLIKQSLWGAQLKLGIEGSEEKLVYRIDPSIGMNGSAVYILKDSILYLIGIHIGDGAAIYLNSLRIQIIRQLIQEYCSKYIATLKDNLYTHPFIIYDPSLELSQGVVYDTSSKLSQSEESPFIIQGTITINLEGGTSYITKGSAIGPRSIITSSYEFISTQGYKIHSIYFTPIYKDQTARPIEVVEVSIPDQLSETCALLRLESDISGYKGQLKVKVFKESITYRNTVFVCIHPSNLCLSTDGLSLAYIFEVFRVEPNSAIYVRLDKKFYLLGIKMKTPTNKTIRLNATQIAQAKDWMHKNYLNFPSSSYYFKGSAYFKREAISDLDLPQLKLQSLINLDLSHSNIGPQGAKYLADEVLNNLTALNLAFNNLGPEGAKYISLKGSQNLINLNLAFNNISYQGALDILKANFSSLKHLNLDGNSLIDMEYFYWRKYSLRSLSLMCNQLGKFVANSLSENCQKLIYLNLSNNKILSAGALRIHRRCSRLKYLNLENNLIDQLAGEGLANGEGSCITYLYLGGNRLGNNGSWAFSFNNYKRLKILDLSDNEVSLINASFLMDIYQWRLII